MFNALFARSALVAQNLSADMKDALLAQIISGDVTIFFQDVADADNFASVAAEWIKNPPTKEKKFLFVLTVRPEDLRTPKWSSGCGFKFPGVIPKGAEAARDEYDTRLVALDNVRRLVTFLANYLGTSPTEVMELMIVYDGGAPAQDSNLSHAVHARDYLFDRRDLITGNPTDIGQLISGDEYRSLQKKFNGVVGFDQETQMFSIATEAATAPKLGLARQAMARTAILSGLDSFAAAVGVADNNKILRPLHEIFAELPNLDNPFDKRTVRAFALAPLTGLANIFAMDERGVLRDRLVRVFGQLFAWDNCAPAFWTKSPQAVNILKNQFNVDCDTEAVKYVLAQFALCKNLEYVVLVPTEVVKTDDYMTFLQKLYDFLRTKDFRSLPLLQQLWVQWNAVKGDKPQIIFDPAVGFLAHELEEQEFSPNCENALMDIRPVSIRVLEESLGWNRDVFCMQETSEPTLFYAALDFKPGQFPVFCAQTDELLSTGCHPHPSEAAASA
jgi:hypothetical protein